MTRPSRHCHKNFYYCIISFSDTDRSGPTETSSFLWTMVDKKYSTLEQPCTAEHSAIETATMDMITMEIGTLPWMYQCEMPGLWNSLYASEGNNSTFYMVYSLSDNVEVRKTKKSYQLFFKILSIRLTFKIIQRQFGS